LREFPVIRALQAESDLWQLRRREWWLSAFLVTTLAAVAFLLSSFASLFRRTGHFYDLRSDQVRWGVMCCFFCSTAGSSTGTGRSGGYMFQHVYMLTASGAAFAIPL
jgi:hypothetical protein